LCTPLVHRYALCEEELKKPMAMKLVCVGEDETVVGLHVIGYAPAAHHSVHALALHSVLSSH
jgi:hypothetical protein